MNLYYTYVLLCLDTKHERRKFYVGTTNELNDRLHAHRSKSVQSTKQFNSIHLVYYEVCLNKTDARKRELQLKTGFGRGYILRRLENYLKEF